jgi:hypothetical protein
LSKSWKRPLLKEKKQKEEQLKQQREVSLKRDERRAMLARQHDNLVDRNLSETDVAFEKCLKKLAISGGKQSSAKLN